jgi:hypothetical protein
MNLQLINLHKQKFQDVQTRVQELNNHVESQESLQQDQLLQKTNIL